MYLIHAAEMIGREIRCPRCFYAFVVEEPNKAADEVPDNATKKTKPDGVAATNEKPINGMAAKPTVRRGGEDDEDKKEGRPAIKTTSNDSAPSEPKSMSPNLPRRSHARRIIIASSKAFLVAIASALGAKFGGWLGGVIVATLAGGFAVGTEIGPDRGPSGH
jgi:hypothetical protein